MPVHPHIVEFPRMLYKGDDTRVVTNADEKAAAFADGWTSPLLPGETAEDHPGAEKKRGRPPVKE